MFYDESVLLTIASAIGKPVKVDLNTLNMIRGRFARVCVEINLEEPVVGRFFLNGVWYNVEYEGLHLLCSSCGCYGHVLRNFPHVIRSEVTATSVGEKDNTDQPPRDPLHGADSAAPTGEESVPRVRGAVAPDPHGDWLIVKQRNQKSNLVKPLSKGRSSAHNGSEAFTEQHHIVPGYSKRSVHNMAETRAGFKNPREPRESPREQEHALGSRGELGAHPQPVPAGESALAASNVIKDRSQRNSPHLGDPRIVQDGRQRTAISVLQTGCTINVNIDSEDNVREVQGEEDIMQYDQPLETMMV
ncbi:uncharacterized protein LOC109817874 [Cajanus cajan]|uniref:uncharacterized protein LOC109817874 n=1 Tax=Cajanus cajan TaxID=3821 RepID=UPI00098D9AA0|nr:uncharacterized protein LOC109817874 [Cajanus cajan]